MKKPERNYFIIDNKNYQDMITKHNGTEYIDQTTTSNDSNVFEQESVLLQNNAYTGRFKELLKDLALEKDFKYLIGEATSYSKIKNQELVLRFASFYFNGYQNYYGPINRFMADTLEKYRDIVPRDEVRLRADFRNTIHIIRALFGKNAFKRFYRGNKQDKNGKWDTENFHIALYDILTYSFANLPFTRCLQNKDRIDEALINLMSSDEEFIDSIELSTGSKIVVVNRFEKWCNTLQQIIENGGKAPGSFTYELKFDLFTANGTCALCGEKIKMFDDSTIDNIPRYWLGNKTIPVTTPLAHRYCKHAKDLMNEN